MHDPAAKPPELDIASARAPSIARAGGGIVLAAGVLALLVGIQTMTGFNVSGRFQALLAGLALTGAANAVLGLMIMKARAWAALAGVVSSGVLLLATSTWLVLSMGSGLVSLFALGAPLVAMAALAFAALSIGPCKRASEARERLLAEGLDMGT